MTYYSFNFILDMCHFTFSTLGNAPLEQEILTLFVAFIGELECSAVVRKVVLYTYTLLGSAAHALGYTHI